MDDTLECLARHILLLLLATDTELAIPERIQLFLELHGNVMLRPRTRTYLADKATELLRYASDVVPHCPCTHILMVR
jgi:hypothetical protein